MLELVSLTETEADRRVGNYSLGMRQRLGIATALIGDPAVLILDEPANGLDPAGIRWMRDLLRDYADHGGTVLLSSHLLPEIEIIADDIVMIGNGRIVCQGSKTELLQAAGTVVRAADIARPPAGTRPRPASTPPSPRTGRSAPTRTRRRSDAWRYEAAWRSPSCAPPTGRTRGDVPPAHRRHPTRKESGMTAITIDPAVEQRADAYRVAPIPLAESSASSSARCSTPVRASG